MENEKKINSELVTVSKSKDGAPDHRNLNFDKNKIKPNKKEVEADLESFIKFKCTNWTNFLPVIGIWIWAVKYFNFENKLKSFFISKQLFYTNIKFSLIFFIFFPICIIFNYFPLIFRFIVLTKMLILCQYILHKQNNTNEDN